MNGIASARDKDTIDKIISTLYLIKNFFMVSLKYEFILISDRRRGALALL